MSDDDLRGDDPLRPAGEAVAAAPAPAGEPEDGQQGARSVFGAADPGSPGLHQRPRFLVAMKNADVGFHEEAGRRVSEVAALQP